MSMMLDAARVYLTGAARHNAKVRPVCVYNLYTPVRSFTIINPPCIEKKVLVKGYKNGKTANISIIVSA